MFFQQNLLRTSLHAADALAGNNLLLTTRLPIGEK